MRLTDLSLQKLPFQEQGQVRIRDEALPGFGVTVGTNSKTFFVMYGQKRKLKTIGRYPQTSLKEARAVARGILVAPPPPNRTMAKNELVTAFLGHCQNTLRPATVRRYAHSLKKDTPETAHDVAAFKAMYNWGLRNGHVTENPHQHRQAVFKQRDRLLSDSEVHQLWKHDRPPFSDIVKLLLLTGQRRGQFQSFDQSWVRDKELHFPPEVMKSKRPHVIPLTELTASYVKGLTPFNGWGKSKARLDEESSVTDWVLHDTRRYFSSTMARIGVPLHITEHLLDHRSSTSGVQAIYMRYGFLTEMREALDSYERHLHTVVA